MITSVDSCVALDLLVAGSEFGAASRDALRQCSLEGKLVVCEIVWAEVGAFFPSPEEATRSFERLRLEFSSIGPAAALHAGVTWKRYRQQGGKRERLVADFLIGSHALHHADRLLTRDRGIFRAYYPSLMLLDPAQPGARSV
jgi:predicted nucleic acid-binding protein